MISALNLLRCLGESVNDTLGAKRHGVSDV